MKNISNDHAMKIIIIFTLTIVIIISMLVLKYIITSSTVNVELAIIETTKVQTMYSGVYELKPQIITMDELEQQYISMNDR